MNFGKVQTDKQTAMYMSPSCIRTGGLKNRSKVPLIRVDLKLMIICRWAKNHILFFDLGVINVHTLTKYHFGDMNYSGIVMDEDLWG